MAMSKGWSSQKGDALCSQMLFHVLLGLMICCDISTESSAPYLWK